MVLKTLLKKEVENEIKSAKDLKDLDLIFRKYLGKNGEIIIGLRGLKDLPKEKRAKTGKELNLLKIFIEKETKAKAGELEEKIQKEAQKRRMD